MRLFSGKPQQIPPSDCKIKSNSIYYSLNCGLHFRAPVFCVRVSKHREGFMKYPVITIAREHGSGGRIIAQKIGKALDIPVYDKTIIDIAAQESGLSPDFIADAEKRRTSTFLYNLYLSSTNVSIIDQVYLAQAHVIQQVVQEGPCVIVGRCGDHVLRKMKNLLRVFVYAPKEERIRRIVEEYKEEGTGSNLSAYLDKCDKQRSSYYNAFADFRWGDHRNYNLMLDSSIGIDLSADIIIETAKRWEWKEEDLSAEGGAP